MDWYQSRLERFLAFLEGQDISSPEAITPAHIRAFLVSPQRRGLSAWYVHGHARAVKTFLSFCAQEGIILESPMRKVKMPRLDKRILPALSPDDVRRILNACETPRDAAIVPCLLDTGLRAGELVALDVGDGRTTADGQLADCHRRVAPGRRCR